MTRADAGQTNQPWWMRWLFRGVRVVRFTIRFAWEFMWGLVGFVLFGLGLTGQIKGGVGYDIFGVVLGATLIGWGYWRWVARRTTRYRGYHSNK